MSWQERMRQMVLAGGVVVAGCSSGQLAHPDAGGTGGTGGTSTGFGGSGTGGGSTGTGGAAGAGGRSGTGGSGGAGGSGGTIPLGPCGNGNPDPCICGRPDASASNAALCDQKMTCEKVGGVWAYFPGKCSIDLDAGPDARRDGAQSADGDVRDR